MFDFIFASADWIIQYAVPFVIVLSLLVFVHEWGHYAVARYYGVKIDAFSIGFGPELFGWTDKEGCRWKIAAIPLGGFVKMFGDAGAASTPDGDKIDAMSEAEKTGAFYGKPVGQRALIVFAGPAINYIFAALLMMGLFVFNGRPVTPPVVGAVSINSAAAQAGLQTGDEILSINGEAMERFEDVSRYILIGLDHPMTIELQRGDDTLILNDVRASRQEAEDRFGFTQTRATLGITSSGFALDPNKVATIDGRAVTEKTILPTLRGLEGQSVEVTFNADVDGVISSDGFIVTIPDNVEGINELGVIQLQEPLREVIQYGPITAIWKAVVECWNITTSTLKALGQMITGVRSAEELGGLIRIGAIASDAAGNGMVTFIMFAALLSINLGLINLFPIPMLDGGHLAFYAVEAVRGKPVPENIQEKFFKVGFFALIGLMLFANVNDLVQILR